MIGYLKLVIINESPQKKETQTIFIGLRPLSHFIKTDLLWISSTKVTNFSFPKSIAYVPKAEIWRVRKFVRFVDERYKLL
jgi:hypothetical protein